MEAVLSAPRFRSDVWKNVDHLGGKLMALRNAKDMPDDLIGGSPLRLRRGTLTSPSPMKLIRTIRALIACF
jgi:hypothetical protein